MILSSNRSEWLITLAVIICSVILLGALAVAIGGNPFRSNTRIVTAVFPDVTGIRVNSPVKYAGATAGEVASIRMLTPAERAALPNPGHSVEISLALNPRVPELTEGAFASLAADTILADKFVLITPGAATSAPLPSDAILNGVAPTTFDALSAEVATSLASLRGVISGISDGGGGKIFQNLAGLMEQIGTTLTQTQGLVKNADQLVGDGIQVIGRGDVLISDTSRVVTRVGGLVDNTEPTLEKLMVDLQAAAVSLDRFAAQAEKLIRDNAGPVNRTTVQLERAVADLRITSAHTKTLAESLVRRPQQIIWGTRREPNQVFSEREILAD